MNRRLFDTDIDDRYEQNGGEENREFKRMLDNIKLVMYHGLTMRQRQALVAYYIDGRAVCDIAGELSITPAGVYRHLERGRNKIRRMIGAVSTVKPPAVIYEASLGQ